MTFRKILFWFHLFAGVLAGVVIAVMCFTGVTLAFEKEIINWVEKESRVAPAAVSSEPKPLDELLAAVREKHPGQRPSGITLKPDSTAAVLISFGRTNSFYVNPYTAEVREPSAQGTREFMRTMIAWHRFLGTNEDNRAIGKAITGACNVAFLVLALTGLYLWWPRKWTRDAFRAIAAMNFRLKGKARDWNWHNAIGLWSAPVLIVLTATAMPISYRWAGDVIYKLTGTTPPPPNAGPTTGSEVRVPEPEPGAKRLPMQDLLAAAQKEVPQWKEISFRLSTGGRGGRAGANAETDAAPRGPQAVSVTVKERGAWPLFASITLSLDPFTGAVLKKETFASNTLGRQVRSWTRYLHTGEALGPAGQAVAGLASFGGLVLVWTGFALAIRRFANWRGSRKNGTVPATS